ncbi:ankyrin, partial [Terfezia boudieri ATCC MYA-4762]
LSLTGRNGHLEVVKVLLDKGATINVVAGCNRTPLHIAAKLGHFEVVQVLLNKGALIDAIAHDNSSALHFAAG